MRRRTNLARFCTRDATCEPSRLALTPSALGVVGNVGCCKLFLPVLTIKRLDFYHWPLGFVITPVDALESDSVSIRIRPRPVPRQNPARATKPSFGCFGPPKILCRLILKGSILWHIQSEIFLRNDNVHVSPHRAIRAIAIPGYDMFLVCSELPPHYPAMALHGVRLFVSSNCFLISL